MTSESEAIANRANAKKSTGPRTPDGKAKVSRNALRHGLGAGNSGEADLSERIERLAKAIWQHDVESVGYRQALIVAESFVDITRVRAHRIERLHVALPEILALERYERRALSRRRRAIRTLDAIRLCAI